MEANYNKNSVLPLGDLFSDGGDFSDMADLPLTTDESGAEDHRVPVRDEVDDGDITVEDLPTKLTVPSYRDALVQGEASNDDVTTPSSDVTPSRDVTTLSRDDVTPSAEDKVNREERGSGEHSCIQVYILILYLACPHF
eukprot:sb/3474396/